MKKRRKDPLDTLNCSFCSKSRREVEQLIAGPKGYICDQCVDQFHSLLWAHSDNLQASALTPMWQRLQFPKAREAMNTRDLVKIAMFERNLLSLCGDHPYLLAILDDNLLSHLDNPVLSELLRQARTLAREVKVPTASELIEIAPEALREQVASAVLEGGFARNTEPELVLNEIERRVQLRAMEREIEQLCLAIRHISQARGSDNDSDPATNKLIEAISNRVHSLLQQKRTLTFTTDAPLKVDSLPES